MARKDSAPVVLGRTKKDRSRGRPEFTESDAWFQLGDLAALESLPGLTRAEQAIALAEFLENLDKYETGPKIKAPQDVREASAKEAAAILKERDPRGVFDPTALAGCAVFAECLFDRMASLPKSSDQVEAFEKSVNSAKRHLRRLEERDQVAQEAALSSFAGIFTAET